MPIDGVTTEGQTGEEILAAVQERLNYLRPLVAEYERLTGAVENLRDALALSPAVPTKAPAKARLSPEEQQRRAEQRRTQIAAFASAQNGNEFTAAELAAALGVDPRGIGPTIGAVERAGVIRMTREEKRPGERPPRIRYYTKA